MKLPVKVLANPRLLRIEQRLALVDAGILRRVRDLVAASVLSTMRWHVVQVMPSRASMP